MAVGTESRAITLYSIEEQTDLLQWVAHESRVKQVVVYSKLADSVILVSVSTDGYIKMWSVSVSISLLVFRIQHNGKFVAGFGNFESISE